MELFNQISRIGIIPVVKINDAKKAVPLAMALKKGGLCAAEITFRTDAAEQAIRNISSECPDVLVGAGTVLTLEQAERALDAGAKFIVSPGFNPTVVDWCIKHSVTPLPGCTTPTEIEQALSMGLNVVKFFPAEQSGGLAKIKALSAPYGNIKFMPTGGINPENMNDYLNCKTILACGGSFMVKESLIDNENWDEITALTKKCVDDMLSLELAHIGINHADEKDAEATAKKLFPISGYGTCGEKGSMLFPGIELMNSMAPGKCGHIAISTNSVDRAIYHLSLRGVEFDETSAVYDKDGKCKFIYLKDDFAGFKIHLCEKQ